MQRQLGIGGWLTLLASVAWSLTMVAPAHAGSYGVVACADGYTKRPNNVWRPFNDAPSRFQLRSSCPAPADERNGSLDVRLIRGTPVAVPVGGGAGWIFDAPPGLRIDTTSYTMHANGYVEWDWNIGSRNHAGQATKGCPTMFTTSCPFGTKRTPAASNSVYVTAAPQPPKTTADRAQFGITCVPTTTGGTCATPSSTSHWAELSLYSATVYLAEEEPAPPEVSASVSGGEWVSAGGNKAVLVHVFARDLTGISWIVSDASFPYRVEGACDYTQAIPCRDLSTTLRLFYLPEGRQTIPVTAADPTGAVTTLPVDVGVDSVAPSAPQSVTSSVGSDWQGSQDATVHWTLPDESGRAPITAAEYMLCDGGHCTQTRPADSITSTTVSVPYEAEWQVKVWLTDAAGNVSPSRYASTTVRYAVSPPAAPSNLRRDDSAEWQRDPLVRLTWDLPSIEGAPVTKAWVRRCDAADDAGDDCDLPVEAATMTSADVELPADGPHRLEVWLENAAGLSQQSAAATTVARLDTEPPQAPADLALATVPNSPNATGSWAPPVSDGAPYSHSEWSFCPALGGVCVAQGQSSARSVALWAPAVGEWRLTVAHVDSAGNVGDPATTSWTYTPPVVPPRVDPDPPIGPDPPVDPSVRPVVPPILVPPTPFPTPPAPAGPGSRGEGDRSDAARAPAALKLRLARAPGRSLRVELSAPRSLSARVSLTVRATVGRSTRTLRRSGTLRRGRLELVLRLPPGTRSAVVTATTPATVSHRAGSVTGGLRLRAAPIRP